MANSLRLSAITLHNVLERQICICNLENKQEINISEDGGKYTIVCHINNCN